MSKEKLFGDTLLRGKENGVLIFSLFFYLKAKQKQGVHAPFGFWEASCLL